MNRIGNRGLLQNAQSAFSILAMFLSISVALPAKGAPQEIRLSDNKPTVFLTFDRVTASDPEDVEDSEQVWLVLHNNTIWPLSYAGRGVVNLDAGGDEAQVVRYDVQVVSQRVYDERGAQDVVPVGATGCTWGIYQLKSGQNVRFPVPRYCLAPGLAVAVSYNYSWEARQGTVSSEPTHFASFSSYDLDAGLRQP